MDIIGIAYNSDLAYNGEHLYNGLHGWRTVAAVETSWTSDAVEFGVPYNSLLLYNGAHTYNESDTPFHLLWTTASRAETAWN